MVRYGTSGDGSKNEAGLPNITGQTFTEKDGVSGCFYLGGSQDNGCVNSASALSAVAYFDASRSSPIYGSSDTVMPDSYNQPVAIYLG